MPSLSPHSGSRPYTQAEPRVGWLFVDLNSYFASVEQQLCPELRNRPVAVVPVMAETTCAIAASYEAKAFGIKTGTQVAEARRLCPEIVFVEARHEVYVEYHKRIVAAVEQCVPVAAVCSIDEMACRLLGREQSLGQALELARRVKAAIRQYAGDTLRCSVGLAPNRYLAKVASDMEKPDGLVALTPDLLDAALRRLALRDLPGIGARMERRLHAVGIRSMEELLALDREGMRRAWGSVSGEKLWYWLRGEDFSEAEAEHPKSISHSHVLPPELRTIEGGYAVAHKLLHKAAMRLRSARMWTTHLSLAIKFVAPQDASHGRHYSGIPELNWAQGRGMVECQDHQTLIETLRLLWSARPTGPRYAKPFYVGVWLGNLVPDSLHTLSLFGATEEESRRTELTSTIDRVNQKYGLDMLASASALVAKAAAPTRIAFTRIPDLF